MSDLFVGFKPFSKVHTTGIVSVHDPITPAEVYKGEAITASLTSKRDSETFTDLSVYRLSPLGAEIDITPLPRAFLEPGSEVDLDITIAKQSCKFWGISVNSVHIENNRKLVGVRWVLDPSAGKDTGEKRQDVRWLCGEHFLPTGVAPNPAKFNDFVYFSILDISRGGMQLSTSMRNKFLIPGMVLEAVVSFPLVGQLTLHLKITNARLRSRNGRDFLSLGAQIIDSAPEVLETVGQYLLQFGPQLSVEELKKEGFEVKSAASAVEFGFVKTVEEYRDVLKLRRTAYSLVGKADEKAPIEKMSDIYDAKSRILFARHKGEIVASMRITFHAPDEKNEYELYATLPTSFPRKDELVVISRLCTDPRYRGNDLMYSLMRQCMFTVLQSRRRYMLSGAGEKLVPVYERLGFKRQGIFFTHEFLKGVKEEIILADVVNILSGTDVSPSVWNELYSDLAGYITNLYDISLTPEMNLRMRLYKSVSFLTRMFTTGVRNPDRK